MEIQPSFDALIQLIDLTDLPLRTFYVFGAGRCFVDFCD